MSRGDKQDIAQRAQRLLEDPLLVKIFEDIKMDIVQSIVNTEDDGSEQYKILQINRCAKLQLLEQIQTDLKNRTIVL